MGFLEEEVERRRLHDYVEALELELQKMLVFHRELPFSLELVSRALESYRSKLGVEAAEKAALARSDCEEETSSDGPVLKEFIPTARGGSDEDEEVVEEEELQLKNQEHEQGLWLQLHIDPQPESPPEEDVKSLAPAVEAKKPTGTPQPLPAVAAASSTAGTEEGRGQRKTRRCWSPELHRQFLQALQQLGGSHVATPKQIREMMKVEGLTNDEVKSHLQKYRLHTRRASPPVQSNAGGNPQAAQQQIVFIGSLWTPPAGSPESSVAAADLQPKKKQKLASCKEERRVKGGGSSKSESSGTTASSSHTITTSESPRS